jgi:transposase-like protein
MENTRVEALRRQVEEERTTSGKGHPKLSNKLKRDVVALLREPDWGFTRTSKTLGLSESSLYRWSSELKPKHKSANKKKRGRPPMMKHVKIVGDAPVYPKSEGLRLELGSGASVSGLSLDDVAELLRRLS